jgi:dsRNA-specific ribonuclease
MEKKTTINPYNPKNRLITKNEVQNILKRYQIFNNINDLSLFQRAFVHDSFSLPYIRNVIERDGVSLLTCPDGVVPIQPESYERLEFLGDRVIEIIIADYVFQRYPDQDEGFLSRIKVSLVNGVMLSHLSRILGLGKFMIVSKTMEDKEQARLRDHLLEDIFEAFIGAIYLDFNVDKPSSMSSYMSGMGFHVAQKFLINLLEDENSEIDFTELIMEDGNIKDQLVRYYKHVHKSTLTFKTIRTEGQGIDKVFVVKVISDKDQKVIGEGKAANEKQAHHEAARVILSDLKLLK